MLPEARRRENAHSRHESLPCKAFNSINRNSVHTQEIETEARKVLPEIHKSAAPHPKPHRRQPPTQLGSTMSKRKSAASQKAPANKRVKNGAASAAKPQAPAGASEVDEMLKRAMEMQDDFDDDEEDGSEEDEGSSMSHDDVETIGNSEESAAESESDLEEDEEAAAVVLPVAESSKSAQARVNSVSLFFKSFARQ